MCENTSIMRHGAHLHAKPTCPPWRHCRCRYGHQCRFVIWHLQHHRWCTDPTKTDPNLDEGTQNLNTYKLSQLTHSGKVHFLFGGCGDGERQPSQLREDKILSVVRKVCVIIE